MRPVVEFAFHVGRRRGELCGLTWENVVAEDSRPHVVIRQARVKAGGAGEARGSQVRKPKTDAGIRAVALDREAVDLLRAHRTRQAREPMANRDTYKDLVFANELGNPLGPHSVSREFRRARDLAGSAAGRSARKARAWLAERPEAALPKPPFCPRCGTAPYRCRSRPGFRRSAPAGGSVAGASRPRIRTDQHRYAVPGAELTRVACLASATTDAYSSGRLRAHFVRTAYQLAFLATIVRDVCP